MPDSAKPLPGDLPDLPAGSLIGEPIKNLRPGGIPAEGLPELPQGLPELPQGVPPMPGGDIKFKEMPPMKAGPYIKRAIKLLSAHKAMVAVSLVLSLIMCLLPFVAAAAIGPLFKLFGQAAAGGDWSNVWSLTSSFYD